MYMRKIIITAGGTSEPIDRVRKITNSSTGKLGVLICNELLSKEEDSMIYYIHSKNAILPVKNDRIVFCPIESTADLESTITNILTNEKIDIVIHAMAVSDYTTKGVTTVENFADILFKNRNFLNFEDKKEFIEEIKHLFNLSEETFKSGNKDNKISSSYEDLLLSFKQTTKIISLIKKISPFTFLVGFKLLDGVPEEELFDVGFNLLRKNKCNLVLANDLSLIREGNHTGLLIYPEKKYDKLVGKETIASELVEAVYNRAFVKHPKSLELSKGFAMQVDMLSNFETVGNELYKKGFLPEVINHDRVDKVGTYGNISLRNSSDDTTFFITGRNVNKGKLNLHDICHVEEVIPIENESIYCNVKYRGNVKPSIDSAIHSEIYKITNFNAIIHIHTNKVFLGKPITDYNYPCGSMEERDSIIKFIKENPENDIVQLYKHGLIVMGDSLNECLNKIETLFNEEIFVNYDTIYNPNEEFISHIKEVQAEIIIEKGFMYPIIKENEQIAVLWEDKHKDFIDFGIYTYATIQGKGYNIAKKVISMYGDRKLHLHTMDGCNVKDFYVRKFGFKLIEEQGNHYILEK